MLSELFKDILKNWVNATKEQFSGHPIATKLRENLKDLIKIKLSEKGIHYKIKASAGAGNWANVPWLSMLDPNMTQSTQEGIYPVYLFRADGTGFYLSLELGTTDLKNTYGTSKAKKEAEIIAKKVHKNFPEINSWCKDTVNLRASTDLGKSYEWGSIGAKFYPVNEIPSDDVLLQDLFQLIDTYKKIPSDFINNMNKKTNKEISQKKLINTFSLPKPFILLAGISGTGKTRFVLEQAKNSADKFELKEGYNCCLVPVRPDWHEPSDLLGYISRISGTNYISTDFLIFIVKAWCNAIESADSQAFKLKPLEGIAPFWLCLDEMNLAPVEQYFADYLSILETRKWEDGQYFCQPIMKKEVLGKLRHSNTSVSNDSGINSMDSLWSEIFKDIDVEHSLKVTLCEYFESNGIALPPNLIVAGTVNMDETTHGFSRKVIDRALTIDFQEFFPNDYDHFFEPKTQAKLLSFPVYSQVKQENFSDIKIDSDGTKTKEFLTEINKILKDTPFELAFRALNEILLSTVSFNPKSDVELMAVWDDFLMQKVLPRIEGDMSKLRYISADEKIDKADSKDSILDEKLYGKGSVLHALYLLLSADIMLGQIWEESKRPDLLRESVYVDGTDAKESPLLLIECRTKKKLQWMMRRLKSSHFTNFWV